jgi:transcription-repair coupling factor (superfamily II helicase)
LWLALTDSGVESAGRKAIGGAPEGHDARILAAGLDCLDRPIIHVCRDDARLARLSSSLAFFAPDAPVLALPAWDCVPYDRVSPNAELVARRLTTLAALSNAPDRPVLLLTTVSAILQRVPPPSAFQGAVIELEPGSEIPQNDLLAFFGRNGYRRAGTVREPGEYAIRGGIVDVYPPGEATPLRLDFFGDELESIRRFDAVSQRTIGEDDALRLIPVSEVILDGKTIAAFRERYRATFGPANPNDTLYEAVSAGTRHPGIEHWLPLFWDGLATVFDYLPGAAVTLDHQADAAVAARLDLIDDYYQARVEMLPATQRDAQADTSPIYQPVATETLFLDDRKWRASLKDRLAVDLTPFQIPDHDANAANAGGAPPPDFAAARAQSDISPFDAVRDLIGREEDRRIVIAGSSAGARDRLAHLLSEHGVTDTLAVESWPEAAETPETTTALAVIDTDHGFTAPDLLVISEQDILGERLARASRRRRRADQFISEVSSLNEGDLVVHIDHGIGRYDGLETLTVGGAPHDCLRLLYAGDDRLYVPVENIEVLSRYGSEDAAAQLDRLGAPAWQARKARAKERIREIADQLLKVAAARVTRQGETMETTPGAFEEFCARFAFSETEDQQGAIDDVVADLQSGRPMDRLVCGDVGFGKTEVALRAAFVAAMTGAQVAIVVPTTLLAHQHFQTFKERFKGLPLRIEQVSRLVAGAKLAEVKDGLADGSINIVVGTHALLAKSVAFAHLGLLVVDEEQHFGVAQKERLKQLKADVHVLTLTATPIPRTLQMALAGVRELSMIATPPVDRLAVRTFVLPYDPVIVREAIRRETYRGGQIFYVCPRIADIDRVHERLRELVPDAKIAIAHGRMPTQTLEKVITDFSEGRFEILLSTNIVEAGLDIPRANTIVVHRADRFGLAQLYQLRGRVGRSKTRAYAYLTLPPRQKITETASKRLSVMQALDTLGAGFTLASHDLDIRGAGNLLGEEQSGHIKEVGVELYQQLLEEAITRLREGGDAEAIAESRWSPQISIGISVLIPEHYVADLSVRLSLYRRLSRLEDRADIDAFAAELVDRFGPLPDEVEHLLKIIEIKQNCYAAGIEKVDAGPKGAVIAFRENKFANPQGLIGFIQKEARTVNLRPDHTLLCRRSWERPADRLDGVAKLAATLAGIATS